MLNTHGIQCDSITTTERNALTNPPFGLIIVNSTTNRVECNLGTPSVPSWMPMCPHWSPPPINMGDASVIGTLTYLNGGAGKYYSMSGGAADDVIAFNWNLSHMELEYDGSDLAIEIEARLSSNGTTSDTVGLVLEYAFVKAGDNSTTTITAVAQQDIDVSAEVQDINFLSTLGTMSGAAGDTVMLITITRNSSGAGADAYSGAFEILGIKIKKV